MCSIAGILDFQQPIDNLLLSKFNGAMKHRGPDDAGIYSSPCIGLAHTRLSIQDLSAAGHQPMLSRDGRFVLCYNGEIYNHLELRAIHLQQFSFRGHSDTETLVELFSLFIKTGKSVDALLGMLNGMFAFALWDNLEKTLLLVRDRMGVKPLYLWSDGKRTAFASEMKAFTAAGLPMTASPEGIKTFLVYGHSIAPDTIYSNVKKVRPGTYVYFRENSTKTVQYWTLADNENRFTGRTEAEAAERLLELLNDSIRARLISDVPFGAYLSGGIDSSTIVALMQKLHGRPINTFSVGFDVGAKSGGVQAGGKYSELADAATVAAQIGSIHHELVPTARDLIECIDKLVYHYDEPFGDPAAFPTYMVSKLAREHVTVCHSGEGADELFGGYRRYRAQLFREQHPLLSMLFIGGFGLLSPVLPRVRRMRKTAEAFAETDFARRYSKWLEMTTDHLFVQLTGCHIIPNACYAEVLGKANPGIGNALLLADQHTWLIDGYMEKLDKASMAFSLEAREPFLDFRIVEFANSLPIQWKIGKQPKQILRRAVAGLIPKSILSKPKRGFAVPLDEWFRSDLKTFAEERLFSSTKYFKDNGINVDAIKKIWTEHQSLRRDHSSILWQLLVLSTWFSVNKPSQIS